MYRAIEDAKESFRHDEHVFLLRNPCIYRTAALEQDYFIDGNFSRFQVSVD